MGHPRILCRRWPRCGCIMQGYVNDSEPNECGVAECTCEKPHPRPWWHCAAHGEVTVDVG
jgi:hypothetical protein